MGVTIFGFSIDNTNMEYGQQVKEFFENIRKCEKCNEKACKYIGTLDERLAKYRELREAAENKAVTDDRKMVSQNLFQVKT